VVIPNPPIKGHRLLHEGHSARVIDPVTDDYAGWSYGCECGDKPDPTLTISSRRRWHREHKATLRSGVQMSADIVALADEFSPGSFTDRPNA
jgi:hypothetical protein